MKQSYLTSKIRISQYSSGYKFLGEICVNRGVMMGIICGVAVFLVIFSFLGYFNSDFDKQLIDGLEDGVPKEKLMGQIENQTQNGELMAKKRLDTHLMDSKDWEKGDLVSEDDYVYYIQIYQKEMGFISDYDRVRKEFVNGNISKDEFLDESKKIKDELFIITPMTPPR